MFKITLPFTFKLQSPIIIHKRVIKQVEEEATLVDILTKLLMDNGCTVNKPGVQKVAEFVISSCLQAVAECTSALGKVKNDIESEHQRF